MAKACCCGVGVAATPFGPPLKLVWLLLMIVVLFMIVVLTKVVRTTVVFTFTAAVLYAKTPPSTHHRQSRLRQSESLVHAVEADLCPPITGVEDIRTAGSPPSITRCPEISRSRSEDPRVPGTQ